MKLNHHPTLKTKSAYPPVPQFQPFHNYLLVRKVDPPRKGDVIQDGIVIPHNIDDGTTTELVEIISVSDELIRQIEAWAQPGRFPFTIGSRCVIQKNLNMLPIELNETKYFVVSFEALVGVLT